MSDCIDRKKALDALDELCNRVCPYSKKQRSAMCGACTLGGAFDVIEELLAADVCPHYVSNKHDRGNDSYCRKYNCEVR